jgi:hypothetical protein
VIIDAGTADVVAGTNVTGAGRSFAIPKFAPFTQFGSWLARPMTSFHLMISVATLLTILGLIMDHYLSGAPVLLGDAWRQAYQNIVVVSPDVGGVVRARALAKQLGCPNTNGQAMIQGQSDAVLDYFNIG